MYLHLDHHSGEPIYRQIVEQIKYRVVSSQLFDGQQLPSIRSLAGELKINPRTVVKAYEELQHAGLVVMKHGQGVFVSTNRQTERAGVRRKAISEMARRMLSESMRMGSDTQEIIDIVKSEADKMEPNK